MIDEDEIVFNDLDDNRYSVTYLEAPYDWCDPIFFVDYQEYGNAIIYDDPIKDERISLLVGHMDEMEEITISEGPSIDSSDSISHRNRKQIKFVRHYRDFNLSDFIDQARGGKILSTSRLKFLRKTKGYLKLPAFL